MFLCRLCGINQLKSSEELNFLPLAHIYIGPFHKLFISITFFGLSASHSDFGIFMIILIVMGINELSGSLIYSLIGLKKIVK